MEEKFSSSLQDPVRSEREQAEACRQAREVSIVINMDRGLVENSEILQVTEGQPRFIAEAPKSGEKSSRSGRSYEHHTQIG